MQYEWPVIAGILLFIVLYIYATTLYPGGSQADIQTTGFDWSNNYWCNVLSDRAMNGLDNPARPYGIIATCILSLTMIWFFVRFALIMVEIGWLKTMLISLGAWSMIFAIFLGSGYHDIASILSGSTGVGALSILFYQLYRYRHYNQLSFGLFCAGIIAFNNFIYFTGIGIAILPLLQKWTLLILFSWVILVNHLMNQSNIRHWKDE